MIERCDRFGQRYSLLRALDMEAFDKLPVHDHDARAGCDRFGVRSNDPAGRGNFFRRWREDSVRGSDCLWMNQCLAVEPKVAPLAARSEKTFVIGKVEMNAIQNCETEGASDQETMPECCH